MKPLSHFLEQRLGQHDIQHGVDKSGVYDGQVNLPPNTGKTKA